MWVLGFLKLPDVQLAIMIPICLLGFYCHVELIGICDMCKGHDVKHVSVT
jgi:hypothetical protein